MVPAAIAAPVVAPALEATAKPADSTTPLPQPQPRPQEQGFPQADLQTSTGSSDRAGEPLAVAARAVLDRHCAGCHQNGRLSDASALPAAGIGNILDLAALARNGALVTPKHPDASPLYQQMVARQMPPDPRRQSATATTDFAVGVEELAAVRAWIDALPQTPGSCEGRAHIDAQGIANGIAGWIDAIGAEAAAGVRFVSLASLANACASDGEMAAARQGVARLLNGLSWLPAPAKIEAVGDDLALLAFRLGDLGWTAEHWSLLLARLAPASRVPVAAATATATGTPYPVLPADWLAAVVGDPALYGRLLGLPPTLEELAGIVGVALDDERESRSARRGAVSKSAETGRARFIDRYTARRGAFWVAYDPPAPGEGAASVLDEPLTGWAAADFFEAASAGPLEEPASTLPARALFELPNGFPAFASFAQPSGDRAPGSGGACLACHAAGARTFDDKLPAHVAATDFAGSDLERDLALQVTFQKGDIERRVEEQARHVAEAEAKAGIAPGVRLDGLEPVGALAARYRRAVDLAGAAADMLIPLADLRAGLRQVSGDAKKLALRLEHGRISRPELEKLKAAMAGRDVIEAAALASAGTANSGGQLRVELWPAELPRKGDELVRLVVEANGACHLTLVNIDASGKAIVLYPNEFDRENLLKPGEQRLIPGRDASYRFRLPQAAPERFVAICEDGEPVPAGMTPDLTRHNFTALGNWESFIASAHRAAGSPRLTLENGDDPDRRFRRGRKAVEPTRPAPAVTPGQARAAIVLRVDE